MGSIFSNMFPPAPTFTEKDIGDLSGRVCIVTGSSSGVGFEVADILYSKNATVYVAVRSADKGKKAIKMIKANSPSSTGRLEFLALDLADLSSIRKSAEAFLTKEGRLDILIHNAGIMTPPAGNKTKLGHDLEMGTNCLGPLLFQRFLEEIITRTASSSQPGIVRVVWVSSLISVGVPRGVIQFDEMTGNPKVLKEAMANYMQSKVGDVFLATDTAKRLGASGVFSLSVHPGLMRTELQRHASPVMGFVMKMIFKPARYGAYSELFTAMSPSITGKDNGRFVLAWGRLADVSPPIAESMKTRAEGGTGVADRFVQWCEKEIRPYL